MKKVDISFLNNIQDCISESFLIVDALNPDNRSVQIVRNMLESLEKNHKDILERSTSDGTGLLYVYEASVPEILYLRTSARGIMKKSLENPEFIPRELVKKMEKFHDYFDDFFEMWVTNN